ncbi:hypothetical protein Pint_25731 [Pistacia integerrima]|uniref:Uncharacterized protein n=1 Tax=Pistacia integerrima TaxID=434235 RepID=A0ACC0YJF1_9ROSI|nr:hypothetical protein Pint_25731 [Pistacia integerrima]
MDSEDDDFYSGEAMDDENDYYNTDDAAYADGYDDEDDDDDDDDYEFMEEVDEEYVSRQQHLLVIWVVGCSVMAVFLLYDGKLGEGFGLGEKSREYFQVKRACGRRAIVCLSLLQCLWNGMRNWISESALCKFGLVCLV